MSDDPHPLELVAAEGRWGGPSYRYRGAEIDCLPGGNVCAFRLASHPLSDRGSFGVPGTITPLADLWLNKGQLPAHYRAAREA
ncbi:hypothetical protein [Paracraurococcus ruber]|uniref:Uncharacterized protein n=1 Tax=Paracraurococcus ruber TaxID=77675 RepID=A0ABS1D5U1_9PROT|nr:hypothetical protein [Paracraurococcus ruber]MBK1661851.1 hypothetical protein [Paracraurococcus ruber]TDG28906.1 hypothetical protein E2C05_19180 [Paracraurococcus ruber]